jgi:cysteinyl-tRNA synthetase
MPGVRCLSGSYDNMQIDKETLAMIVALAAIVSSMVGALSALLIAWLTKKYEDRRHLREIAINTAYKEWEYMANYLRSTREGGEQLPLSSYVLFTAKIVEMALDKTLNSENIEARLAELHSMDMRIRAHHEKQSRELAEQQEKFRSGDI